MSVASEEREDRMASVQKSLFFAVAAVAFAAAIGGPSPLRAADVIADWAGLTLPPAPELKPVTLDGKTTALLILDIQAPACTMAERPRCVDAIPKIKALMDRARAAGALVAYTLPTGKIADPSLEPHEGEVVEQKPGGPDKFLGTDLDQRLKARGTKTVIITGTSAQGVGIGTGSASAQRGYNVIYPVDGVASETAFREAYAAWHMGGGGPPVTTRWVTVTRSDMIKF
jgi:nicotinamidase-related amidase